MRELKKPIRSNDQLFQACEKCPHHSGYTFDEMINSILVVD
jgi:hypothetical protein